MNRPKLDLWWDAREPAQADDARRLSEFVTGLPDFDPIYESWLNSPTTHEETVSVPLSEREAKSLLIDNMTRLDSPNAPCPKLGSHIWGGHAGPPPYDFRESSYADTSCHIGAFGRFGAVNPNHIFMRLSALRPTSGRPWRASEVRPLMKFALEIWKPAEMCVMLPFLNPPKIPDPTWAAGERTLKPWIGWITYLPAKLAARAEYPADVELEVLEDGAALVTLCEEPFEKGDAEGMTRLHALQAALRPIQS
jgi:hypothetical protein